MLEIREDSGTPEETYQPCIQKKVEKGQTNKSVSNLVTNLEPLISQYRQKSSSVLKSSVKPSKVRPVQEPLRIKFEDSKKKAPTPPPKKVTLVPNLVSASDSLTSSADTLDDLNSEPVQVSYKYYASSNSSNDKHGYKLLCEECATKVRKKEDTGGLADKIKTTISEESLSACSLAEPTNEYKIKSITIKIGKPYYL